MQVVKPQQGGAGKIIDLAELRKEAPNKSFGDKKPFKKNDFKQKGKNPQFDKKPQSKEQLDRELESYWLKSGDKSLGKFSIELIL